MNNLKSFPEMANSGKIDVKSTYEFIYRNEINSSLKVKLKHYLRIIIYKKQLNEIYRFFLTDSFSFLSSIDAGLLDKIFRPYISKQYSVHDRVRVLKEHYKFVSNINGHILKSVFDPHGVEIGHLCNDEYKLVLRHDGTFRKEGELSVSILDSQSNTRMYSCAFSFGKERNRYAMFIGAVQGPEKDVVDAALKTKEITKKTHGIMPKNLVVIVAMMIAKFYNINHDFYAIRSCSHIYQSLRYNMSKNRVSFDYDSLWAEFDAIEYDRSFVKIADYQRKDIASVPSKKRSEYRKRFSLLDEINENILKMNRS